jgi:putative ABC transport system permease protein
MFKAMLRGLLTHKLRLLLSSVAVVLGTMFMSGAFIGGDTIAVGFERLFATFTANLDVQVAAESDAPPSQQDNEVITAFVDPGTAGAVAKVDGVATATPMVTSDGARVVGKDGKVVTTNGQPRLGVGWTDQGDFVQLRSGRAPTAPNEIAIDAGLAKQTGFTVGDTVDVLTLEPRAAYDLVGIFGYEGGRDSLAGETTVAFTMPTAQRVMLDAPGEYTSVDLTADAGVGPDELKRRVEAAVGDGYVVRTREELAAAQADDIQGFISILKNGLAVFAFIGLFTGAFLIFNTFSMLVAQRTRELALYRAFGASRGQVNRAVLVEAALLGLASSVLGLLLGMGVGAALASLLAVFSNVDLPGPPIVVRPYVVVLTLAVGIGFTVVAALAPAARASRVPPVAAMRESVAPDRPLGRLTVGGAVLLAAGAGMLTLKLTGAVDGANALLLGGGALLGFLGVAMLAPAISRPVTNTIGRLVSFTVPGRLGTRNTGRNPRRTAITASALMIGVALATGAGIFATSAKAGITDSFRSDLTAQLIVGPELTSGGPPQGGFDPAMAAKMAAIPGVLAAFAQQTDMVQLDGRATAASAGDVTAARTVFTLEPAEGVLRTLRPGELVMDEPTAQANGWRIGDELTMRTARGGELAERLVGTYRQSSLMAGPILSPADAVAFRSPLALQGFVTVAEDEQVPAVEAQLTQLFADNPEVVVTDTVSMLERGAQFLDVILTVLNVLLGLTIVVAVLGVINTLLLSIYERTREIGLIRAVGMGRAQVARMITVESVLISVFGALLGIVVGAALGIAIVMALDRGGGEFLQLTVPWGYLAVILVLAVLAGVVAAVLPAVRAARLNVLAAIAYE